LAYFKNITITILDIPAPLSQSPNTLNKPSQSPQSYVTNGDCNAQKDIFDWINRNRMLVIIPIKPEK